LGWAEFVHKAGRKLVEQGRRPTVLTLAWQCHQLGNDNLGNELLAIALAGAEPGERFAVSLAGIEYLATTGQQARALALLEPLLADNDTAQMSPLWRLGATLAQQQAMTARSAKMLEQALAIEYGALGASDVVNLENLRRDYGELLGRYGELATALASLEEKPSPELLARLVGAADRWRGMEDDVTQPCHQVARIFSTLGADALAWQYVTTPLAARPNEAAPWVELAVAMKGENNYAMADRAYREAFRSEGSNAQILWDHAQMLSELGRYEEARKLYEQIAAGDWQPRFAHLHEQARRIVGE
jgi:tetratricopeptide (TPR) repeat protein